MASVLDGELAETGGGTVVRIERPSRPLPLDRERLARLPGQPPPNAPLLCLDTETTGLGTATGTYAFLIGLGWWEADRFRQVQLLLPDHADEPALLAALTATVPAGAWLVTYNGRGFDWPLLETRFRLQRSDLPPLAGHLDLLPLVRRVFRHRLPDARLRSVELGVLGLSRVGDVEGWQIPGRYLEVIRGASPSLLIDIVHHNDLDVRSLANVLAHVERHLAESDPSRLAAPAGDLAGLARAYRRDGRQDEALGCLDAALAIAEDPIEPVLGVPPLASRERMHPPPQTSGPIEPWWSPRRRPDIGGRPDRGQVARASADASPWTFARIATERARLLRAMGRPDEAIESWHAAAGGGGRAGAIAWIEIAKLEEHQRKDLEGALAAAAAAGRALERARALGRPEPRLELGVAHRAARLRRKLARGAARHRTSDPREGPTSRPVQRGPDRPVPPGWAGHTARAGRT